MDLYPTLVNGGKLAVLPKDVTANFKDLFSWLPQLKLNTWVSTPSFADICLINPDFNAQKLPDLNYFLFCGEELTHATAQKLKTRFPSAKIYNTYGPTEATVAVTQVEITQDILDAYPRLPIGICKDDAQIVLLDDDGKDVALGQTGEIVIVGGGVSKAGDIVTDVVSRYYKPNAFHACRTCVIKLAELGNDAGMYGAVKMVL